MRPIFLVPHAWPTCWNTLSETCLPGRNETDYMEQNWKPGQQMAEQPSGDWLEATLQGMALAADMQIYVSFPKLVLSNNVFDVTAM